MCRCTGFRTMSTRPVKTYHFFRKAKFNALNGHIEILHIQQQKDLPQRKVFLYYYPSIALKIKVFYSHRGHMKSFKISSGINPSLIEIFHFACVETLIVLFHGSKAHSHTGETSIVEKILHGHLFGKIREQSDAIACAITGISIT